jgi:hypothetical protein
MGVGIIIHNQPPQVLENLHPFQFFPVRRKRTSEGLLGTYSSLMLLFSLPTPLTQLCAVVTSIEVLHWHLQTTTLAFW